jgi:hypothetical protein
MGGQLPAHGPGCRPLTGLRSFRLPDEPRFICTPNCPRRNALAQEVGASLSEAQRDSEHREPPSPSRHGDPR